MVCSKDKLLGRNYDTILKKYTLLNLFIEILLRGFEYVIELSCSYRIKNNKVLHSILIWMIV